MEHIMYEVFQNDLLKNERILWAGQPDPKALFTTGDIFWVPFSILWGGFFIFFGIAGWRTGWFFIIFSLPFFLIGLYAIFGRFLYKIWKKKRTYYAVTDRRVLILTALFSRSLQAVYIDTIPSIHKSVRFGRGTITFGNRSFWSSMYANTGMGFFGWGYGKEVPTFYDIKDVDKVFDLVNELRNKEERKEF